ncbi:MAG: adenylyltransferase/cytidyltransferase family protein [Magnetococcales bacterium]|nr:adenylyltransferase/cytidyltransferase family protein [Magnetococcales bacterium]
MTESKIVTLDQMAEIARRIKAEGRSVVLCHGAFDLMHPGHIRHLTRAREEGDVLLVTVTGDRFVNKGPGRPVFPEGLRAETLASLQCVDYVAINHDLTAVPVLQKIQPTVFVKGQDYKDAEQDLTGNITLEKNAVEAGGGRIFYTEEITFSSSSLLNENFNLFPPATDSYLRRLKSDRPAAAMIQSLKGLQPLKALVVGEAILDEYCYSTPQGQTGKSGNILAVQYNYTEQFAGGTLAVANHLAGFVSEVTLLAGLGRPGPGRGPNHEAFFRKKLAPNVKPVFFYFEDAPTLVKRRFVDQDMNKLFEVYFHDHTPVTQRVEGDIRRWIEGMAPGFDLVLVPDYGNGFITSGMVDSLCSSARYLAVNTQLNSGNRGYHVVTRYPRADFVSLNEPEIRLAAHDRHAPLEEVAGRIADQVKAIHLAVTLGTKGAIMLDRSQGLVHEVPALSTRVVDRIGAGDAFLALSSLCLAGGLDAETALFVGSVAAALDVQIVCNRESIDPVGLHKYITTLLK